MEDREERARTWESPHAGSQLTRDAQIRLKGVLQYTANLMVC